MGRRSWAFRHCGYQPALCVRSKTLQVLLPAESPLLEAHLTREMDRLWRGAELGINERLARKLAANRRRCASGVRRG